MVSSSPDPTDPLSPIVRPRSRPRRSSSSLVSVSNDNDQIPFAVNVIPQIEAILESITDALVNNRVLSIPLRIRSSGNGKVVRYPSTNAAEVKRFTCIVTILSMAHEALVSGTVITKRNIYYQNTELFGTQSYVDRLVDDISFTLSIGRSNLNIVAASKGLISGNVLVTFQDGFQLDCSLGNNGTPVPEIDRISKIDITFAGWILVIEKEAIFRSLAASRYFQGSAVGPGIIVTGKGYPDLATRKFLHQLHLSYLNIPIYALVDFDFDGITIMRTYKFGSSSLRHEQGVTIPNLSWLGVTSDDVLGRNQPSGFLGPQDLPESAKSFSPLTARDRIRTINLTRKLMGGEDIEDDEVEIIHELQLMLMLNIKAEIQAVDDVSHITAWLNERLLRAKIFDL